MKVRSLILKILLIFIILLCIDFNSGCKGPEEYAPPADSLIPPPEPPQPLSPPYDTAYWFGQGGQGWEYVVVVFEWTPIEGAQQYELVLASSASFGSSIFSTFQTSGTRITVRIYSPTEVYWHVRAESNQWTWFTDWSETWYFRVRWPI